MRSLSIFLAVLGGAAMGAAAGLLLAPESGEETRRHIKKFLREKGIYPRNEEKLEELVDEIAGELGK